MSCPAGGPTTLRRSSRPCCTATGASGRRSCGTTAAIFSGRCSRWRRSTPAELQALLHSYRGIGEEELWDNCRYFLRAVLPVAEECGVKLALHPDDPPRPIFGLPRIAKNAADYRRILFTPDLDSPSNTITFCCGSLGSDPDDPPRPIFGLPRIAKNAADYRRILFTPDLDSPSNTITFCCGSLGSGADNDLPAMIREFGPRGKLPFVHFRNVQREPGGDFYESGHQTGCGSSDMGEIMRALCDMGRPFCLRPDHGRRIWDEAWSIREVTDADGTQRVEHRPDGWNGVKPAAGYGLFDRALGAAYAQGLYEGIRRERAAQLTKE